MSLFEILSQPVDEAKVIEGAKKRAKECRLLARESITKARESNREDDKRYYAEEACFWRRQAARALPLARELLGKGD